LVSAAQHDPAAEGQYVVSRDDAADEGELLDPSTFDDLSDEEKVRFVDAEVAAAIAAVDEMIRRRDAVGFVLDDPDGLVQVTLGPTGGLAQLWLHDAACTNLNNIGLEQKLNAMFAEGQKALEEARNEIHQGERDAGWVDD
jgi:hypothetical protein